MSPRNRQRRAAALTAQQARRHMPKHEPGEPVRPALLDAGEMPSPIAVDDEADLPAFALLSSQFLLADFVTSREQDEKRWEKMERVLDRQRLALDEIGIGESGASGVLVVFGETLPITDRIAFLVDLYFLDPFAPYTLKSDKVTRMAALRDIALLVGGDDDIVDRIDATRRSALAAHTSARSARSASSASAPPSLSVLPDSSLPRSWAPRSVVPQDWAAPRPLPTDSPSSAAAHLRREAQEWLAGCGSLPV